jgi:prefoldin subunit 5
MKLSQKTIALLTELNHARADYRLVQRMQRLESVEEYFYQRITQLTKRIEELERALQNTGMVRQGNGSNRLCDIPATGPDFWKDDSS